MKLTHLRNVTAIAERGSLRAAARHLGIAQPALSRSVHELEHELGVPLFERRARGMILTPMGEAFVRRAGGILADVRRAREEVDQLHGGTRGTVVAAISIVPHIAMLPHALRPFRARYPEVEIQLIEGLYANVESGLKDGSIDFYVGTPPERALPPELVHETLSHIKRVVVARKGHPLAAARTLRDLTGADWLTTSFSVQAKKELNELFARFRLPGPRLVLSVQSALSLIVALTSTDMLALAPAHWSSFPPTADTLTAIAIRETIPTLPLVVVKRAGLPLTPAAELFLEMLRRNRAQSRK